MNIAICDDCREDAEQLRKLLHNHQCKIFSAPSELLLESEQKSTRYDLYLLDIYIGENAEGIKLAQELRNRDNDAAICFISSSDEFYREAYDIQDINYLLKPLNSEAVSRLIARTERRQIRTRQQCFCYKWNGQIVSVPYGNIIYINSNNHILNIICKDDVVRHFNAKLNDVEALLDSSVFFRCHQSFLVNLYCVDHLSGSDFVIGEKLIPISRRYFPEAKRRYLEILFEEVT